MTLIVIIFILGVMALRMGDGILSFVLGVGFLILTISMSVNTAIENPDIIPHKKEMARATKETKKLDRR